jgi:carbonic anhydrase/acetyltransferase-like protein (isoleucine patch superfamily)
MPIHVYNGISPKIDPTAFVAPGAQVIGDVEIGPGSSVWYNTVLRGDLNHIRIGRGSNVQDGSVIHVDSGHGRGPGFPCIIGDDVLIGHLAIVHGCQLLDGAFVGMGAIVMDGCVVEGGAMLAAGAMLTPGKRVPAGELWGGRPAKLIRPVSDGERLMMSLGPKGYAALAQLHREQVGGG